MDVATRLIDVHEEEHRSKTAERIMRRTSSLVVHLISRINKAETDSGLSVSKSVTDCRVDA